MASQDQDKAASALLRRSLGDSEEACPEPEILAAYFERSLDAQETARYDLHFSRCARCRELLATMDRTGELVHAEREKAQKVARWSWLWDWRLLAPAAAVLVLAAVWADRRTIPSQPGPLVALSRSQESAAPAAAQEYSREQTGMAPNDNAPAKPPADLTQDLNSLAKQSPALIEPVAPPDKKQFAANLPENTRNEVRTDSSTNDAARARDSVRAADNIATLSPASENAQPSASPSMTPAPAPAAPVAPQTSTETAVGVGSQANTIASQSVAPKTNSAGASANVHALAMTQPQFQSLMKARSGQMKTADELSAHTLITTPDAHVLWRISGNAYIERSIDSGATWQSQLLRPDVNVIAGFAPSARVCWVAGNGGIVMLTKDAENWKTISPPVRGDFVAITAQDASSATVTTADGRKFITSDGGKHWNPAP
jgi:hypothetical protein